MAAFFPRCSSPACWSMPSSRPARRRSTHEKRRDCARGSLTTLATPAGLSCDRACCAVIAAQTGGALAGVVVVASVDGSLVDGSAAAACPLWRPAAHSGRLAVRRGAGTCRRGDPASAAQSARRTDDARHLLWLLPRALDCDRLCPWLTDVRPRWSRAGRWRSGIGDCFCAGGATRHLAARADPRRHDRQPVLRRAEFRARDLPLRPVKRADDLGRRFAGPTRLERRAGAARATRAVRGLAAAVHAAHGRLRSRRHRRQQPGRLVAYDARRRALPDLARDRIRGERSGCDRLYRTCRTDARASCWRTPLAGPDVVVAVVRRGLAVASGSDRAGIRATLRNHHSDGRDHHVAGCTPASGHVATLAWTARPEPRARDPVRPAVIARARSE